MAIKDIKNASSVLNLMKHVKKLPYGIAKPVGVLFKERDRGEQMAYIKGLPEETVIYLLKASTYVVLASGVVLKESVAEVLLTKEIQEFLDKVKQEIGDTKEITKEKVSAVVDTVLMTVHIGSIIGLIVIVLPLVLNPVTMPMALGVMLFIDMLMFVVGMASSSKSK